MSKGEERIAQILKKNKVKFEQEKSFSDLQAGLYRFDFFLPDLNGGTIIEFNGAQHYSRIAKFHPTQTAFTKGQEHDRRKISYALAHKYDIYCIPYWDELTLETFEDLFRTAYKAKSKWHNDITWREHQKIK